MTRSSPPNGLAPSRQLPAEAERALADAAASWALSFGTGSQRALCDRYARALEQAAWPGAEPRAEPCLEPCLEPRADFARLRAMVEREHREAHGAEHLAAEAAEERERDAAVTDDAALVAYEHKWARRLVKLQRVFPGRWRLPGLSDDELRDELTLRLIDALRTQPDERAKYHRAGKEWGLLFLAQQRRVLHKGFKLEVVLADLSPALDRGLGDEERLIEQQSASALTLAGQRAERGLSRPQRRWWAAMKVTANAGAFFEASGKLNLSAVSRLLDKNRSSAHRAFDELQHHFAHELKKLGG